MVLREIIEQAISGTDHAVVAEERAYVMAFAPNQIPRRSWRSMHVQSCKTHQRMAPLFLALRDASSTEPEAQQVWQEINDRRAGNMRKLAKDLKEAGGLRRGVSIDQAADIVWAMNSAEMFVLLTIERGWSLKRFERWLADSWCRILLD